MLESVFTAIKVHHYYCARKLMITTSSIDGAVFVSGIKVVIIKLFLLGKLKLTLKFFVMRNNHLLTGASFLLPPLVSLANNNISLGVTQNQILYWDMGVVTDSSISANDSLIYMFGITLPLNYNTTAVNIVVEQSDTDFIDTLTLTEPSNVVCFLYYTTFPVFLHYSNTTPKYFHYYFTKFSENLSKFSIIYLFYLIHQSCGHNTFNVACKCTINK